MYYSLVLERVCMQYNFMVASFEQCYTMDARELSAAECILSIHDYPIPSWPADLQCAKKRTFTISESVGY